MKETVRVVEFDKYEHGTILNLLNDYRNILQIEERKTGIDNPLIDAIDELLLKLLDAPEKKRSYRRYLECR